MEQKNVKEIFEWAMLNGETKIADRILVKLMPKLVKFGCTLTANDIANNESILVPNELYQLIKTTAEDLLGTQYKD